MTYGDPRMPFPRDLHGDEPAALRAFSRKSEVYWKGRDGQSGHIFLATAEELNLLLKEMRENKIPVAGQMARLRSFRMYGKSPMRKTYVSGPAEAAINLGKLDL